MHLVSDLNNLFNDNELKVDDIVLGISVRVIGIAHAGVCSFDSVHPVAVNKYQALNLTYVQKNATSCFTQAV